MWIKLTVSVGVVREFDEVVGGAGDRLADDGPGLAGCGLLMGSGFRAAVVLVD